MKSLFYVIFVMRNMKVGKHKSILKIVKNNKLNNNNNNQANCHIQKVLNTSKIVVIFNFFI